MPTRLTKRDKKQEKPVRRKSFRENEWNDWRDYDVDREEYYNDREQEED